MLHWMRKHWRDSEFAGLELISRASQFTCSLGKVGPLGSSRWMLARTLPRLASVNSCFQVETHAVACGRSSLQFHISSNISSAPRIVFAFVSFRFALLPLCSSPLPTPSPTPFPFAKYLECTCGDQWFDIPPQSGGAGFR